MYGHHMWGIGFGWFIGLFFIVLIIWLIIRLVNQDFYHRIRNNSAMDILKERYAKGEIGKEEFEEKRKLIEK
jgi:putative membrane protein